jgi:hypothetical protein
VISKNNKAYSFELVSLFREAGATASRAKSKRIVVFIAIKNGDRGATLPPKLKPHSKGDEILSLSLTYIWRGRTAKSIRPIHTSETIPSVYSSHRDRKEYAQSPHYS